LSLCCVGWLGRQACMQRSFRLGVGAAQPQLRAWARARGNYGSAPVIVYEPDGGRHGNFSIQLMQPSWLGPIGCAASTRSNAQAARSLPKPQSDLARRLARARLLHELRRTADERLCTPASRSRRRSGPCSALKTARIRSAARSHSLDGRPAFRLPNGRFDRTEVDLRFRLAARGGEVD